VPEAQRVKRPYNSQRRRQQADATRNAILDAAQLLFERHGYVTTTMEAIAAEAGVALKTVYSAYTTKSGLLRATWDRALKGDSDDAPVAARDWYQNVLDEPDPERQLQLNARNSRIVKARIGPMLTVIRDAAVVDDDSAQLWRLIQRDFYDNQRTIVERVARRGHLRRGITTAFAADVLWTLNHPDTWSLLVTQRGWTPARYEHWLVNTSCEQLLAPRPAL
jgi:AcrR family transcriptional regulator